MAGPDRLEKFIPEALGGISSVLRPEQWARDPAHAWRVAARCACSGGGAACRGARDLGAPRAVEKSWCGAAARHSHL